MKLSIIIVSWNTRQILQECLQSVYDHPPRVGYEVWVVDNASADGSAQMVREAFPQVNLVENTKNVGFAGGNNQALPLCQGQYVLLLNPDTVVRPEALQALVDFLDTHPEAGAAGSMLLNPDETLQTSTYPAPTISRELWRLLHLDRLRPYGVYHMARWDTDQPREVDVVQGASLLVRRQILDSIGLFDTAYFMYSEEVDLCHRIQEAGWQLYWVPESKVLHYGGQSTRQIATKMFLQLYHAKLLYFRKHYGAGAGVVYKVVLAIAAVLRLILYPLGWLLGGERRQRYHFLARHYAQLLVKLPTY